MHYSVRLGSYVDAVVFFFSIVSSSYAAMDRPSHHEVVIVRNVRGVPPQSPITNQPLLYTHVYSMHETRYWYLIDRECDVSSQKFDIHEDNYERKHFLTVLTTYIYTCSSSIHYRVL